MLPDNKTGPLKLLRLCASAVKNLVLVILLLAFQNLRPSELHPFEFNGSAQGTTYHIIYYASSGIIRQSQLDSIFNVIDHSLSIYQNNSLISRFNNSEERIKTDLHLEAVVSRALTIFNDSEGRFDITVLPLMKAWGFFKGGNAAPDSAMINSCLSCVGSEKIYLQNGFLGKSRACVQIDVNGIAQGYTVDVIADFLEKNSIKDYLVEVGGELRIKGHKHPGGKAMRVAIEGPADNTSAMEFRKIISMENGAVTTSGIYNKQRKVGGTTISHLMNPKTGYPISNEMISATIVANDAITADGYDNVIMNLGISDGLLFLKKHSELEAYLIYRKTNGELGETMTDGFKKYLCADDE